MVTIFLRFLPLTTQFSRQQQGGHSTGKTGNSVINFFQTGKTQGINKNTGNLDKARKMNNFLGLSYGLTVDGGHIGKYVHFCV